MRAIVDGAAEVKFLGYGGTLVQRLAAQAKGRQEYEGHEVQARERADPFLPVPRTRSVLDHEYSAVPHSSPTSGTLAFFRRHALPAPYGPAIRCVRSASWDTELLRPAFSTSRRAGGDRYSSYQYSVDSCEDNLSAAAVSFGSRRTAV